MKLSRRIVSLLMALVMLFTMVSPVFAQQPMTFKIGFDAYDGEFEHDPNGPDGPITIGGRKGVALRTTVEENTKFSDEHGTSFVYNEVRLVDDGNGGLTPDTFEGWLKYQRHPQVGMFILANKTQTPATSAAVLATVHREDVIYVAKWASVPMSEYENYQVGFEVDVDFQASHADVTFGRLTEENGTTQVVAETNEGGFGVGGVFEGKTLADTGISAVAGKESPVFKALNGKARTFKGWVLCYNGPVYDEEGNVCGNDWHPISGLLTTAQALAYPIPSEHRSVTFVAQWVEPDDDYYSNCDYGPFGGVAYNKEDGIMIHGNSMSGGRKLEGEPVELPFDPARGVTKDGDTHTGKWYKVTWSYDSNGEAVFSTDMTKTYTFDELAQTSDTDTVYHTVPADNVLYIPEWQNVSVLEYKYYGRGRVDVAFEAPEGVILKKGETQPQQHIDLSGYVGAKLSELYGTDIFSSISPERDGAVNEGWVKITHTYVEGQEQPTMTIDRSKIYTTAEALETAPEYGESYIYAVKWDYMPIGEYAMCYTNGEILGMMVDLFGGSAMHWPSREPQAIEVGGGIGSTVVEGYTLAESLGDKVLYDVKHDEGTLEGWLTYVRDADGVYNLKNDTLTTGDISKVAVEEYVTFVAKWSHIPMDEYRDYHPDGLQEPADWAMFYMTADGGVIQASVDFDDPNMEDTIEYRTTFDIGAYVGCSFNDMIAEAGATVMVAPARDLYSFKGWDVFFIEEAAEIWVPTGEVPEAENEDGIVFLHGSNEDNTEDLYIVVEKSHKVKSLITTEQLFAMTQDAAYVAVARWEEAKTTMVTIPNANPGDQHMISVQEDIQIPDNDKVHELYTSVEEIKEALEEKIMENGGKNENSETVFMEIKLVVKGAGSSEWVEVTADDFPEEGLDVYIPFPEGTGKVGFKYMVAHLKSSGADAGQIEILPYEITDNGIRVKVFSLSPFAISYEKAPVASDPGRQNPNTGVHF